MGKAETNFDDDAESSASKYTCATSNLGDRILLKWKDSV